MTYDVVIIVGSRSDLEKVNDSGMIDVLKTIGVAYEFSIISAHRDADTLQDYVREQDTQGTMVFIGAAGMSAHLPGYIKSYLINPWKPVIGVALSTPILSGLDALFSEVRMPQRCSVLVSGLDRAGLYNAALDACGIVALAKPEFREPLQTYLKSKHTPAEIGLMASDKKEGA